MTLSIADEELYGDQEEDDNESPRICANLPRDSAIIREELVVWGSEL